MLRRVQILLLTLLSCVILALPNYAQGITDGGQTAAPPKPTGIWLGQDGHDLAGPAAPIAGSDVQDIHIALQGLASAHEITFISIQRDGGGEWDYNGKANHWGAALVRAPHATTADLYVEPSHAETAFVNLHLVYDDGSAVDFTVKGGKADTKLRMPGLELGVRWIGQDGQDYTGATPDVGPDGLQDEHLALSHLSIKVELKSLVIQAAGMTWAYGLNPEGYRNAELVRHTDDPSQADLYFQPDRDLNGQTLTLTATYSNISNTATITGATTQPNLRMPPPAPYPLRQNPLTIRWLGQDRRNLNEQDIIPYGDIHVAVSGLDPAHAIVTAQLSDPAGGNWAYSSQNATSDALPLVVQRAPGAVNADLYFTPYRSEFNTRLTLLLFFDTGSPTVTQFAGALCDPYLRGPRVSSTNIDAKPGDDLNALCNRWGEVRLGPGTYKLTQPLVLDHPVTITGNHNPTLEFSQPAEAKEWLAAIKINCGSTTLHGFNIRFAGPVRWSKDGRFGPAIIGSTDYETGRNDPRANITIDSLNIESSPMPPGAPLEEEPRSIRMVTATSGKITNNTLKGGVTEVMNGPWEIVENRYLGTMLGTFAYDTFAGHYTHDLKIQNNYLHPVAPCGKTWRFLVLTQHSAYDIIRGNTVEGIGIRDDDTIPNPNAPEIMLTEAYRLHFEGKPSAITASGHILQIPGQQLPGAQTGDAVAILNGPAAGRWFTIAQAINPTTFLMDTPMPPGDYDISIATGFVNENFNDNTVDSRGSSGAGNFILAGNHFGTHVERNHFLGAGDGFLLFATPTENPNLWGWSHAPFVGGVFADNTIEDALRGGTLSVQHSQYIKSNRGRVYMSLSFTNNTLRWSAEFLQRRAQKGTTGALPAFNIGDDGGLDPGELVVTAKGNRAQAVPGQPHASMNVRAGRVNSQDIKDGTIALPVG